MCRAACRLPSYEVGGRIKPIGEELDAHLSSSVGRWLLGLEPWIVALSTSVLMLCGCAECGYKGARGDRNKVDIPESRLAEGGKKLRTYVNENIVDNFSFPEIDGDSQLAIPPTAFSGESSRYSVLENINPVSLLRGHFLASAIERRLVLRRAVRADVLTLGSHVNQDPSKSVLVFLSILI